MGAKGSGNPAGGPGRKPLPEGQAKITAAFSLSSAVIDAIAARAKATGASKSAIVETMLEPLTSAHAAAQNAAAPAPPAKPKGRPPARSMHQADRPPMQTKAARAGALAQFEKATKAPAPAKLAQPPAYPICQCGRAEAPFCDQKDAKLVQVREGARGHFKWSRPRLWCAGTRRARNGAFKLEK